MKKTNYESLIEQRKPRADVLDRAARLEEASRNLETLAALSRAEAAAAEPASPVNPVLAPAEK